MPATTIKKHSSFTLLLVEDDELDVEKIRRCMRRLEIGNKLLHASDGYAALDILEGGDSSQRLEGAVIVLLDLNMPRMNGIEFLKVIRGKERLRKIPVFVMSTSDRRQDVDAAHSFNVSGYITKPFTMTDTHESMRILNEFWKSCLHPELPVE